LGDHRGPAEDDAYQEQHKLGLWNERIRFLILGRLAWADFFGKTFLDELSFGRQMFGNPFPVPGGEDEPHLVMLTKDGTLKFTLIIRVSTMMAPTIA
jgi:hypothetical protein